MKRCERLGWSSPDQVGVEGAVAHLRRSRSTVPEDIHEIVWDKTQKVFDLTTIAIRYFALDDYSSVKAYAEEAIPAADDFFFGSWRSKVYKTEDGERVDAACLRREFKWINYFEAAVLCASVLGDWEFLKKLGTYPKPDSHTDSDYGKQGRDWLVALGAFLREAPEAELESLLERASAGPKRLYKLGIAVMRAGIVRDAVAFQKGLIELLKYYKKSELPKNLVSKKISFEGTFFVHWAEKEKFSLMVPPEFQDHIVRLK